MWKERYLFLIIIGVLAWLAGQKVQSPPVDSTINLIPREFILWLPQDLPPHEWPNFHSHISYHVTAQTTGNAAGNHTFCDDDRLPKELRGTSWVADGVELCHITKGGSQFYQVSWKDRLPGSGSRAETDTITGDVFRVRSREHSKSLGDEAKVWELDESPQGIPIFVGKGLFSR